MEIVQLVPKTNSAFIIVRDNGDLYRVIRETPREYHLESVQEKLSSKGLKVNYYTKIDKYNNIHFDIIKEEDIPIEGV
jgi:hypothetical protein